MKWSAALVVLVPAEVPTVTSTVPVPPGDEAVIVVALTIVKATPALPKRTLLAPAKFVPVIVTAVPPPVGPLFGLTPVTVGRLLPAV